MNRTKRFGLLFFAPAIAALLLLGGCRQELLERTDFVLGTVCTVKLISGGNKALLDKAFTELRTIEDELSANKSGTYIDAVNENAGVAPVAVPAHVFPLIERALYFAEKTNGAFDPTVGPLVKLWGIGTDAQRVPAEREIEAACALIDWRDVVLDKTAGTVFLKRRGMRLDLGAIAKGWASDRLNELLSGKGAVGIIDLGGNIQLVGMKKNGKSWKVGVQNPFAERNNSVLILTLERPMAVITSGIYERYFTENGRQYHHLLDTKMGYPIDNGLVSVTIIADSGTKADGLSTTIFALGLERGLRFAEQEGVDAILVDSGHRIYTTKGASAMITDAVDSEFSLSGD